MSDVTVELARRVMRFLGTALGWRLVLYIRVIRRMGVSAALASCLLLVFILIPVVPFLAAHINSDNLLFVAVPLTTLLGLRLIDGFREKRLDAQTLIGLVVVLLLSG